MKKVLTLVFLLIASFTLVACNKGEEVDLSSLNKPKTTLTVWFDDAPGVYTGKLKEAFEAENPDIVVKFMDVATVDARTKLKTYGPSGMGCDIFQFPHDHLAAAYNEGLLYDLPESLKGIVDNRSHPLGVDIATVNGTLMGVPMSVESIGLYYNTDLIETPHATMEALLADGALWNAAPVSATDTRTNAQAGYYYLGNGSHWADAYFLQPIFSAFNNWRPFGANGNDRTSVGFELQGMQDALAYLTTQIKPVATGTGNHDQGSKNAQFEAGNIPYILGGPWNLEAFSAAEGLNFAIAPFPTIKVGGVDKEVSTFAGAQIAAVYKYAKNPTDALKFMEFLTTDTAMQILYEHKYKLPALKTELLANVPGVTEDEYLMAFSEQLETSIPMPTIAEVQHYWGPAEAMVTDVWNKGVAIAVAVADAETSYKGKVNLGS